MRADLVAILSPILDDLPCLRNAAEPVFVQTFVADFVVEAFGVAVLLRLAGLDVVPVDVILGCKDQHGAAGQLRAVVGDDNLGLAARGDQPVQLPHNAQAWQGCVCRDRQTLSRAFIDHRQHVEPSAVDEGNCNMRRQASFFIKLFKL